MNPSLGRLAHNKKLMAYTAAAMYGGAALDGAIEGLIPGDPRFAVMPALAAAVVVTLLVAFGPRLPRAALALLGPIGVALIAVALAETPGAGDGAVLYVWPVLWMTFYFGRRGAIASLVCIGVAHALVLLEVPAASSFPARWIDVMVSTSVAALVVLTLVRHNDEMLVSLQNEARTDALTGLLNRRGFDERATLELARARREDACIALVVFDLDYFKRVNDEWGHEVGDRVLIRTAEVLLATAREIDVVARFGGEEFVVLLPGTDSEQARDFAERVRAALSIESPDGLPTARNQRRDPRRARADHGRGAASRRRLRALRREALRARPRCRVRPRRPRRDRAGARALRPLSVRSVRAPAPSARPARPPRRGRGCARRIPPDARRAFATKPPCCRRAGRRAPGRRSRSR
jgi:diguanylate cyclase (GGDEF)-like protein